MSRVAIALLLPLVLAACVPWGENDVAYQGYVEGDYIRVAAEHGGRLEAREVDQGDEVEAGQLLFRVDDSAARLRLAEARARLAQAEAQQISAAANLAAAEKEYERVAKLREGNVSTPAQLDAAAEKRDMAKANLEAADRNVAAVAAARDLAETEHERHFVSAPVAGRVDDVYFEPGELITAGQAVLSLLPPSGRRILFFVPETDLAAIDVGKRVTISCDGCADRLTAVVSYIASDAEFTPPVIFSRETRDKLVYRVEAEPEGEAARLKIGQPIDIEPLDDTGSDT